MKKVLRFILVLLFFVSIFYCKAEEKPIYLIIVPQIEDKKMVKQYVEEKIEKFTVILTSLKENYRPVWIAIESNDSFWKVKKVSITWNE